MSLPRRPTSRQALVDLDTNSTAIAEAEVWRTFIRTYETVISEPKSYLSWAAAS